MYAHFLHEASWAYIYFKLSMVIEKHYRDSVLMQDWN